MRKSIPLILAILMIINYSCGLQYKPLYIETAGEESSISKFQDEYFEIELCSVAGKDYIAEKFLSRNPVHLIRIVDENGEVQRFTDSTQFLNYMLERGYEMADQTKRPYCTAYTFMRR